MGNTSQGALKPGEEDNHNNRDKPDTRNGNDTPRQSRIQTNNNCSNSSNNSIAGDIPYVFISYHDTGDDNNDISAIVYPTYWFLKEICQVSVFMRTRPNKQLDNKEDVWQQQQQQQALVGCTHALVLLTPNYQTHKGCRQEWDWFTQRAAAAATAAATDDDDKGNTFCLVPAWWRLDPPKKNDDDDNDNDNANEDACKAILMGKHAPMIQYDTQNPVEYMLQALWPALAKLFVPTQETTTTTTNDETNQTCLGTTTTTPQALERHLLAYTHLHVDGTRSNGTMMKMMMMHKDLLAFFAEKTKGIPLRGTRVETKPDESSSSSSSLTGHDDVSKTMMVGVAFWNNVVVKNKELPTRTTWQQSKMAVQQQMEETIRSFARHGNIQYGRRAVDGGTGCAVICLEYLQPPPQQQQTDESLTLPNQQEEFRQQVQTAVNAMAEKMRLLVVADTSSSSSSSSSSSNEHPDLEQVVIAAAWKDDESTRMIHLLVEAPETMHQALSYMINKAEQQVVCLANDFRVAAITPAFLVRAVLTEPLDLHRQENQVLSWKKHDMNVLLPMSGTALDMLSTGGIPLTQWARGEVSWSSIIPVSKYVEENSSVSQSESNDKSVDAAEALSILASASATSDTERMPQPDAIRTVSLESTHVNDLKESIEPTPKSPSADPSPSRSPTRDGLHILAEFASQFGAYGPPQNEKMGEQEEPPSSGLPFTLRPIQEWHALVGDNHCIRTTRATKLLWGIKSQFRKGFYGKISTKWTEDAIAEFYDRLSVIFPANPHAGMVLVAVMPNDTDDWTDSTKRRYGYQGKNYTMMDERWPYFVEVDNTREALTEFLKNNAPPPDYITGFKKRPNFAKALVHASELTKAMARRNVNNEAAATVNNDSSDESHTESGCSFGSEAKSLKRKLGDGSSKRAWTKLDLIAEIAQASAGRAGISNNNSNNHSGSNSQSSSGPEKSGGRKKKRIRKSYDPKPEERMYVELTDNDVGLGRGGALNRHPGNLRFHQEKLALQPRYHQALKDERTVIAQTLVDSVRGWGGEFLKKDEKGWFVVDNHTARTKCSQALRENYTAEERAAKRQRYRQRKSGEQQQV